MGYSTMTIRFVCLAIVCLVTFGPKAEAAVSCGQVETNLTPCVSYIIYGGNAVPLQCCNGVRSLNNMAQTTPDRKAVCNCIKNAVTSSGFTYTRFNLDNVAGLPSKCGVNIPYQISPNTNCNSLH